MESKYVRQNSDHREGSHSLQDANANTAEPLSKKNVSQIKVGLCHTSMQPNPLLHPSLFIEVCNQLNAG